MKTCKSIHTKKTGKVREKIGVTEGASCGVPVCQVAHNYQRQDALFHRVLHLPVALAAVSEAVTAILAQQVRGPAHIRATAPCVTHLGTLVLSTIGNTASLGCSALAVAACEGDGEQFVKKRLCTLVLVNISVTTFS